MQNTLKVIYSLETPNIINHPVVQIRMGNWDNLGIP